MEKTTSFDSLLQYFNKQETFSKGAIISKLGEFKNSYKDVTHFGFGFKGTSPSKLEIGDVIVKNLYGIDHPAIVFKKTDGRVYSIMLSTTEGVHNLKKIEGSRFFSNSYFTKTTMCTLEDSEIANFRGVFDSPKELKAATKLLRKYYNTIL